MDLGRVYAAFIESRRPMEASLERFERHHVLPKCLGGGDEADNLIRLKPEEHLFAHILLAKMHGGVLAVSAMRMLGMRKYAGRRSRLRYDCLRKRHREALLGSKHTPEACAKIGDAHRGKTVRPETRAKLREARARQVISPAHAAAISRANLGNQHGKDPSPETRRKISEAARARPPRVGYRHSPETREKLRAAALARSRK